MENEKLNNEGKATIELMVADGIISRECAEKYFPELKESEDEKIRKHLIKHFANKTKEDWNGVPVMNILVWLERLGEQKPAWSDEDEKFFKTALWHLSHSISNGNDTNIYCDTTNWFRTLKNRVKTQPIHEWSEDDETRLKAIICNLEELQKHFAVPSHQYLTKCIVWLKALKERYAYKPTDEQIDALRYVANHYVPASTDKLAWDALNTTELMLEQLEKL